MTRLKSWYELKYYQEEEPNPVQHTLKLEIFDFFPASARVLLTQLTMMSSLTFSPSPRSSRTFRVYLKHKEDHKVSTRKKEILPILPQYLLVTWSMNKGTSVFLCYITKYTKEDCTSSLTARPEPGSGWGSHHLDLGLQCPPVKIWLQFCPDPQHSYSSPAAVTHKKNAHYHLRVILVFVTALNSNFDLYWTKDVYSCAGYKSNHTVILMFSL